MHEEKNAPAQSQGEVESAAIVSGGTCLDKAYRTEQAKAAFLGLRVERVLGCNGRMQFIVIRRGWAVDCADLEAVRLAMARMGGN